jgi:hypothetical protein
MDGTPGTYAYPITGVHSFAEFGGWLYAGCSSDWEDGEALIMRTSDGATWSLAATFPNRAGIWALAEFGGDLYAGTTGYTSYGADTYLWVSPDGDEWDPARSASASSGDCTIPPAPGDPMVLENVIACEALYRPFPGWVRSLEAWSPALRVEGHSLHRCRRT